MTTAMARKLVANMGGLLTMYGHRYNLLSRRTSLL